MCGEDRESHGLSAQKGRAARFDRLTALRCALCLIALLALPDGAYAQAWLPSKGEFTTSFILNDVLNKEHYLPNGDTVDVGHTRSTTYALFANYGMTDRLMVSASIP